MIPESTLLALASVVILGIGAQWVAWRLHLPSILLLLIVGFVAGPVLGFLDPDALLGNLLIPFVSISVALILFEGGLSLQFSELRETTRVLVILVSLGAAVTWFLGAAFGYGLLGLDLRLAVLLGAILIVTGPTVVGPLLRHVRPTRQVASLLKWEGIVIDPIGAILSVLVFEAILAGEPGSASASPLVGLATTVFVGMASGALGAGILLVTLRRYWIPDFLQESVSLMVVIGVHVGAGFLQQESGLLAVTSMGIILANQKSVNVVHIIEFKENLRVLLISSLFILLAARLDRNSLQDLGWRSLAFLGALILVARPLAVHLSTWGSRLSSKERHFLSWMAPRGIVAASVASVFALHLAEAGYTQANRLVPLTFLVIVGTAAIYGLTARPVARWLGVAQLNPQGVLMLGAHRWAREIARSLQDKGFRVQMVDSDWQNIAQARMAGIPAHYGNVLAEETIERIDLNGLGRLLALTSNDEANSLAALHFAEFFGRQNLFQLPPFEDVEHDAAIYSPMHLRGRFLFTPTATHQTISKLFEDGARIKSTNLTGDFGFDDFLRRHGESAIPLLLIDRNGGLNVFATDRKLAPVTGDNLIYLAKPGPGGSARASRCS